MAKNSKNVKNVKNNRAVALTVLCAVLFAAIVGLLVWVKLTDRSSDKTTANDEYIIVVSDSVTAYEGDEQLLTPHIVDVNGALQQGRFTYAVKDAANAPVTVDESGVITVKENSTATVAVIEITELNTQTKTTVTVTVGRELTGIKGIVFGDELVVATSKQELTFGEEYTVTVKTIPSQAVLTDRQVTVKTVDKYGKEVEGVLDCAVVPDTNKVKITPTGLGEGTMVFSITDGNGKELCKDEKYGFSVAMQDAVLNDDLTAALKRFMSDDPEQVELIPYSAVEKLETVDISDGTATLYGLDKTHFPSLETVVLTSGGVVALSDKAVDKNLCYRVRQSLYNQYFEDAFWNTYAFNIMPYAEDASSEKWAVYHYKNPNEEQRVECVEIDDEFNLKSLDSFPYVVGYTGDYYYIGKDVKPQTDADKAECIAAVLEGALSAEKNGVHIQVGYTANTYNVVYNMNIEYNTGLSFNDTRTFVYGDSYKLWTKEEIEAANIDGADITKTGYALSGWLLNRAAPDEVLQFGQPYKNLADNGTVTLYAAWKPIEYTIKFDDGAGLDNLTVKYDADFKLPAAIKTGYTFVNYKDKSGNTYVANRDYKNLLSVSDTLELTAQFEAITYTLKFDTNGGTWMGNGVNTVTLKYDQSYTLFELSPPTGKTQYEWMQVDSAGNVVAGRTFPHDSTVKNLTVHQGETVRFRAVWDPIRYTIIYSLPQGFTYTYTDINSNVQIASGSYTQNKTFDDNATLIEPVRTGYSALSWTVTSYEGNDATVQIGKDYELGTKELISGEYADIENGGTYYLKLNYTANSYKITYDYNGATSDIGDAYKYVTYDQPYGIRPYPKRTGYAFTGWYCEGERISSTTIVKTAKDHTLVAGWQAMPLRYSVSGGGNLSSIAKDKSGTATVSVSGGSGSYYYSPTSGSGDGYSWSFDTLTGKLKVSVTKKDKSGTISIKVTDELYGSTVTIKQDWSSKGSCVAEGTLVTLADGTQKPVEQLTGNELLLVWNFRTGTFDVAPILCIDSDPAEIYEIINLHFSDGTVVKVVSEHGFWDATLGRYVYLDSNAAQYIGHMFNKQICVDGVLSYTEVRLDNVTITEELTTTWSPVTYSHLCLYVNGMLSMPGGIGGLFNIFEVDLQTMSYDVKAMEADIQQYGLFTYEELSQLVAIPEELFEAVPCAYLKVAIGKGLITVDGLNAMFKTYMDLLNIA